MSSGQNKWEIRSSTLILFKIMPKKKIILKDNFTYSLKTTLKKSFPTSRMLYLLSFCSNRDNVDVKYCHYSKNSLKTSSNIKQMTLRNDLFQRYHISTTNSSLLRSESKFPLNNMIYYAGCFWGLPTGSEKKDIRIWMYNTSVSRRKSNLDHLRKNKRYFLVIDNYWMTIRNNFPIESLEKRK